MNSLVFAEGLRQSTERYRQNMDAVQRDRYSEDYDISVVKVTAGMEFVFETIINTLDTLLTPKPATISYLGRISLPQA